MARTKLARIAAVIVAGVVLAMAAPATAAPAGAPPPPSHTVLQSRLLSAKDVGKGWSTVSSGGYDVGLPACLAVPYTHASDEHAQAVRTFDGGTSNEGYTHTFQDRLVSFTAKAAAARTTAIETSIAGCKHTKELTVHREKVTLGGSQSRAYLVVLSSAKGAVEARALIGVAREGDTVVVATYAGRTLDRSVAGALESKAVTHAA